MSEPVGRDSDPKKRRESGPNRRNDSASQLEPSRRSKSGRLQVEDLRLPAMIVSF